MYQLNELSSKKNLDFILKDSCTHSVSKPKSIFKALYIESYGCQMNLSDSEIVVSILSKEGYKNVQNYLDAELILLNTCSIREKAELTIRKKLKKFNALKQKNKKIKIGILGCMAERLKSKLLEEEKVVDLVVGPDAYKDLPNLLEEIEDGKSAVNVILSPVSNIILSESNVNVSPAGRFNSFTTQVILLFNALPDGIICIVKFAFLEDALPPLGL